jgi:nucleoside-diphosphate kinase
MERTLVLIKPDAIQRRLMGAVITRLEALDLKLIGAKVVHADRAFAEAHYQPLRGKPFFDEMIRYFCGELHDVDFMLALVFWGEDAIQRIRHVAGATNPEVADPTSLRGGYGRMTTSGLMENVLHASSDASEAQREIALWFRPEELVRSV